MGIYARALIHSTNDAHVYSHTLISKRTKVFFFFFFSLDDDGEEGEHGPARPLSIDCPNMFAVWSFLFLDNSEYPSHPIFTSSTQVVYVSHPIPENRALSVSERLLLQPVFFHFFLPPPKPIKSLFTRPVYRARFMLRPLDSIILPIIFFVIVFLPTQSTLLSLLHTHPLSFVRKPTSYLCFAIGLQHDYVHPMRLGLIIAWFLILLG